VRARKGQCASCERAAAPDLAGRVATAAVASRFVHLLLPPSEAKASGGRGRPLAERLDDGALAGARTAARAALAELVAGDPTRAAEALLLPPGIAADALASNAAVPTSRTMPAVQRYAGVVYDGLALASLDEKQQRLAARSILIFSGLFGVVRGDEPIPAYRVPGKAVLPGLGIASTFWRPVLTEVLPQQLRRGLVVDLRSSDYAAMWRPGSGFGARLVTVRVLSPAPRGGYAVISYNSKFAKGRLAAALVRRAATGEPVASAADVVAAWTSCGGAGAELVPGGVELFTA
jgi:cytoplasmic iron level regulating protein YaaA (DUF328/UPF0246 family)